jgi:hypothetical protein
VLVAQSKASARAGKALVLATRALSWGPDEHFSPEARGRVFDAATEFGVSEVAALFARSAPALEVDPGLVDQPDPVIGHYTLGHKKMLARRVDGDRIARFAMEPDPGSSASCCSTRASRGAGGAHRGAPAGARPGAHGDLAVEQVVRAPQRCAGRRR